MATPGSNVKFSERAQKILNKYKKRRKWMFYYEDPCTMKNKTKKGWRRNRIPHTTATFALIEKRRPASENLRSICERDQYLQEEVGEIVQTPNLANSFQLHEEILHSAFNKVCNKLILACKNGKILVWDTMEMTITVCMKVTGEIASLTTWKQFVGVGSTEAQLFHLQQNVRMLLCDEDDPIEAPIGTKVLLSFIDENGLLATANYGGSRIELWTVPQDNIPQVLFRRASSDSMATTSSLQLNEAIISFAALPTDRTSNTLVAIITKRHTDNRVALTLYDWKLNAALQSVPISGAKGATLSNIISIEGRYIIAGIGKDLRVWETHDLKRLRTKSMGEKVTALTYSGSNHNIAVGMDNGVQILDCKLKEVHSIKFGNKGNVIGCNDMEDDTIIITCQDGIVEQWSKSSLPIASHSAVGMKLRAEGIIANLLKFQQNQQAGLDFQRDGIVIRFSDLDDSLNRSFEFALAAIPFHSSFRFPDDVIPISPVIWLYSLPQNLALRKFAEITLPHSIGCKSQKELGSLFFLKADYANKTTDSDGKSVIKFDYVYNKQQFTLENRTGTLEDDHFCFYCIGMHSQSDIINKVAYSLTLVKPISYRRGQKKSVFCVLHFDLDTCRSEIEGQYQSGYEFSTQNLHFAPERWGDGVLQIIIHRDEAESNDWNVTLESHYEIKASEVNFFNQYNSRRDLFEACRIKHTYPPRFTVAVTPADSAVRSSRMRLTFVGATDMHTEEVQLNLEQNPERQSLLPFLNQFGRP